MRLIEIAHPDFDDHARVPEASVPVYLKNRWTVVGEAGVAPMQGEAPEEVPLEAPAKSAGVEDWRAYAIARGMPAEDAENATRGYLIDAYGGS